jgi:hypothetical protein
MTVSYPDWRFLTTLSSSRIPVERFHYCPIICLSGTTRVTIFETSKGESYAIPKMTLTDPSTSNAMSVILQWHYMTRSLYLSLSRLFPQLPDGCFPRQSRRAGHHKAANDGRVVSLLDPSSTTPRVDGPVGSHRPSQTPLRRTGPSRSSRDEVSTKVGHFAHGAVYTFGAYASAEFIPLKAGLSTSASTPLGARFSTSTSIPPMAGLSAGLACFSSPHLRF